MPLILQLTLRISDMIASQFKVMLLHVKHRHRIVLFYVCDKKKQKNIASLMASDFGIGVLLLYVKSQP